MTQVKTKIEVGKTYRHFKGNVYKVIALARNSETNEEMVVYGSSKGDVWVRPKSMWSEIIDDKGTERFTPID